MSAVGEPVPGRDVSGGGGGGGGGCGGEGGESAEARCEAELRALLERGVPRLAAPAQRMRRVRRLVVRRRRRRVAGVVGAAGVAGGVVAAVALVVLGQVSATGSGGPGATYQVPAASPTADGVLFRYSGLDGLTVRLPSGWSGRDTGGAGGAGAVGPAGDRPAAVGLAGDQPAAVDKDRCTDIRRYCLAPDELRRGEGLLVLRLGRKNPLGATGQRARLMDTPPGDSCRLAGGTRELVGWRAAGDSRPHELITASVCLNRPTAVTVGQVRSILGSAVFRGGEATPPTP
ncbi:MULTISPECIES: hypothetical protein [unclassified Streptomyces]|uniref:hypothetical protein n=1 Tax=unclassified Streptomyces TaxID=2593676 RepID=UPI00336A5AAB